MAISTNAATVVPKLISVLEIRLFEKTLVEDLVWLKR